MVPGRDKSARNVDGPMYNYGHLRKRLSRGASLVGATIPTDHNLNGIIMVSKQICRYKFGERGYHSDFG